MRFPAIELVLGVIVAGTAVAMTTPASSWTTTLAPATEASGAIAGTAELDSTGPAQSKATVSIRGDQPGAIRPWHVHHGRCGQGGAVLGSASEYPPIKVGPDGTGSATASLDVATPATGDYLVNVHASAADLQTIVACGDLHTSGK
jgi:superoxide dismutase, Cu-Zn family